MKDSYLTYGSSGFRCAKAFNRSRHWESARVPASTPKKIRTDDTSATTGTRGNRLLFADVGMSVSPLWAMAMDTRRNACEAMNQLMRWPIRSSSCFTSFRRVAYCSAAGTASSATFRSAMGHPCGVSRPRESSAAVRESAREDL